MSCYENFVMDTYSAEDFEAEREYESEDERFIYDDEYYIPEDEYPEDDEDYLQDITDNDGFYDDEDLD